MLSEIKKMRSETKKSVKFIRRRWNPCYLSAIAFSSTVALAKEEAKAESVVNFNSNQLWHKSLKQNQLRKFSTIQAIWRTIGAISRAFQE
jgi:hypothetical protein